MLQTISEMRKVADYCDADDCHSDDDHPPRPPAPAPERPRAADPVGRGLERGRRWERLKVLEHVDRRGLRAAGARVRVE